MEAVLCDTKGCGAIIEGEQVRDYERQDDGWELKITLTGDVDRCAECGRKLFAKAASTAWDELKQTRKSKGVKNEDS